MRVEEKCGASVKDDRDALLKPNQSEFTVAEEAGHVPSSPSSFLCHVEEHRK
jgi:hypothetical protein